MNYQEKYYAAGKYLEDIFKEREARPTEAETLISRLIDRPIRPLFPSKFMNEVQVFIQFCAYDSENQPDILANNRFISCFSNIRLTILGTNSG